MNQKSLEDRLLTLNEHKKLLEAEEAKMPTDTLGRTRAERDRRQVSQPVHQSYHFQVNASNQKLTGQGLGLSSNWASSILITLSGQGVIILFISRARDDQMPGLTSIWSCQERLKPC